MQKSTTWVPFKSIMLCKVNSTSSGRRKTNVPNPLELYLAQNTPKATHEGTVKDIQTALTHIVPKRFVVHCRELRGAQIPESGS